MCLYNITQTFTPPDETVRRGWKIVDQRSDGPHPVFRREHIPYTAEWQTAYPDRVRTSSLADGEYYDTGFHVFATKEDAEWAKEYLCEGDAVVPVEVRGVMYEGVDASDSGYDYVGRRMRTWVAREIRLVKEDVFLQGLPE